MTTRQYLTLLVRPALMGVLILGLTACVATYRNHGYVPSPEDLAEIVPGVDTRDSVSETVGPPSASGVLNESGYYYVASRVRYRGATAPQVMDRQLVAISFDNAGIVRNIERYSLQDGRAVPLERRITDSNLSNQGFIRQLIGNLGGFDPGQFLQ